MTNFYKQLYSDANDVPTNDMMNYIDSMNFPNITLSQWKSCEEVIIARECEIAMQELTSNRAPGLDGIPIEFYKTFWGDIKDIFLDSIIYAHKTGQLCESQYQGVITLIPKPEKELLQITNYQPLTLLNCDYKIVAKVLNNPLKKLLRKIIGP